MRHEKPLLSCWSGSPRDSKKHRLLLLPLTASEAEDTTHFSQNSEGYSWIWPGSLLPAEDTFIYTTRGYVSYQQRKAINNCDVNRPQWPAQQETLKHTYPQINAALAPIQKKLLFVADQKFLLLSKLLCDDTIARHSAHLWGRWCKQTCAAIRLKCTKSSVHSAQRLIANDCYLFTDNSVTQQELTCCG